MLPLRFLLIPLLFLMLVLPSCAVHDGISDIPPGAACPAGLALFDVQALPFEPHSAQARMRLRFTGVPNIDALAHHLRVELDGISGAPTLARDPDDPSVVLVNLAMDPEAWAEVDVATAYVSIRAGLPCHGAEDVLAPRAHRRATLVSDPPPLRIRSVQVHEGDDGHYLEVACEDWGEASRRADPRARDSADGSRCMPDLEAGEGGVFTDPPVPLELAATRGGFLVYGPFGQGELTLTIEAGTRSLDGGMLRRSSVHPIEIPALTAHLSFLSQGRYLPRDALGRIGIRHRNVPAARLQVRHVPRENLLFWHSGREPTDARSSDLVLEQELELTMDQDQSHVTWLDLGASLPDASEGLYELTIHGHELEDDDTGDDPYSYGWWGAWSEARAAVRVLLTDLQIVAKASAPEPGATLPSELLVWALDSRGAGPLAGVQMDLVRPSGTVMGSCTTDRNGGCSIQPRVDPVDPEPPFAILARRGSDTSVLELDELELEIRGDIHGAPFNSTAAARAAAWTDRGVYRPGDTVHLAAILRGPDDRAPAAGLPLTLRWLDSRGRELRQETVVGNEAGMLAADLRLQDFARTGRYRAVLALAERSVGEVAFMVEEIAPERMAVDLDAASPALLPHELADLALEAHWLFGSPAAGSRVELSCALEPSAFATALAPQLHFGAASLPGLQRWRREVQRSSGILDPGGRAAMSCPSADAAGSLPGPATLYARAEVFEGATGRSSKGRARVAVHPERFYIGLAAQQDRARPGRPVQVEGLVVDWDGAPAPDATAAIQLEVLRLERETNWTWDARTHDFRYGAWVRQASEQQAEVRPQQGAVDFTFTPAERAWGYLVVATAGDARTELLIPGERDRWGDSALRNTPGPSGPGWLVIDSPDEVAVGERVPVSIEVPRAGWLLVTAETWRVEEHRWLRVQPGQAQWSFSLDHFAPNVYVSALLVQDPHAISDDSWLPGRAQGLRSVRVLPGAHQGQLSMDLPDEVAPLETMRVELGLQGVDGPAWVAVAAVDEGLISLTRHPVPDPLATLFSKRALGVETFETVGWSLALPSTSSGDSVGGDAANGAGRVQAIEPVALWSGLVPVPASGRATVELVLPSYRGALRVVAVAASADGVATAHGSVPVREPLLVQLSTPRFLIEGDEAQLPVTLHNLGEDEVTVELGLALAALSSSEGIPPLGLRGPSGHSLTLASGQQAGFVFPVTALESSGGATVLAQASAPGLGSVESVDLPLAARLPTERRSQRVALVGASTSLGDRIQGWSHHDTELVITHNPYADALTRLDRLLRYPYGCLEQTSSQTRVLLALGPMLEDLEPALAAQQPLDRWVQDGLDRLQRMQTWGGGFGYWPGDTRPAPWASAYALHVLHDARQAGYAVPDEVIEDGLDYLERVLDSDAASDAAYAHYVLALAGRGHPARARALLQEGGSAVHRYQLMAAVHAAGDHRYEAELRDLGTVLKADFGSGYRGFASPLRDQGMVLTSYRMLFGSDDGGTALADVVAAGLRARMERSATTQELAWALTGLAASVDPSPAELGEHELLLAGVPVQPSAPGRWRVSGSVDSPDLVLRSTDAAGLYAVLDIQGQRRDGHQPRAEGASIERQLLNEAGEPLDASTLEVGQLVYVRLRIASTLGSQPRVALVERLPAGWELENPALSGATLPGWAADDALWASEHRNLRDDRMEVFGTLEPQASTVIYAARVVTAGRFTWPGALLEAMYDPRVQARTAPERVRVSPAAAVALP